MYDAISDSESCTPGHRTPTRARGVHDSESDGVWAQHRGDGADTSGRLGGSGGRRRRDVAAADAGHRVAGAARANRRLRAGKRRGAARRRTPHRAISVNPPHRSRPPLPHRRTSRRRIAARPAARRVDARSMDCGGSRLGGNRRARRAAAVSEQRVGRDDLAASVARDASRAPRRSDRVPCVRRQRRRHRSRRVRRHRHARRLRLVCQHAAWTCAARSSWYAIPFRTATAATPSISRSNAAPQPS